MKIKNSIVLSFALLSVSLPTIAADLNKDEKGKASYQKVHPVPAVRTQEVSIPLGYRLIQGFYTYLHALARYADSDPTFHIPLPTVMGEDLIPLNEYNPTAFTVSKLYTVKKLSPDDKSFIGNFALKGLYFLRTYIAPTAPNLPQIPNSKQGILKLLPSIYKSKIFTLQFISELPETDDLLGYLALQGASGSYIQYTPTDSNRNLYTIDFSNYSQFPVKEGLARLGGKAYLRYCQYGRKMVTEAIEYQSPSDEQSKLYKKAEESAEEWNHKQRIMLATMLTDIGVKRHGLDVHMNIASTFSAVNNQCLPTDHHLRRLMQPHQHKTLFIGHYKIMILMANDQLTCCGLPLCSISILTVSSELFG